jgi:hypothetical protein
VTDQRLRSLELVALLSLLDQDGELELLAGPDAAPGLRKLVHLYMEQMQHAPKPPVKCWEPGDPPDPLEPRTERRVRA